eukprot:TRINITY_DN3430_c0_g1_i1.p1 TRINITY_DN3430_c0_g1~~TRINITY_DN3430_c0_g1_i1.p1  ORF type:complete len:108 (-),score=17.41 TRINITY_DN3430_c0_g1_i1:20-343(-)
MFLHLLSPRLSNSPLPPSLTHQYDVEHILLDNLQFMMSGQGKGFERFDMQDQAIQRFRKFATSMNVHLTLVIHPRKEDPDAPLTTSSVTITYAHINPSINSLSSLTI